MKRHLLILACLLTAFAAAGQNNPYAIDDECYYWFKTAERSIDDFSSDTFDEAQRNLLELSVRRKDTKAQTLYYVEKLKRTSHVAQDIRRANIQDNVEWDFTYWNNLVDQDRETLQRIAKATGYMQYYYHALDVCQTYYYNTGQDVVAGELFAQLMQEAYETSDEYALWKSLGYLAQLYRRVGDMQNTQLYLLEAVRIYENATDDLITRQSMVTQYTHLACTYPVGSDSARLFFNRAELTSKTLSDTITVNYYKAQLAAWDGDLTAYRISRDYCLSQDNFTSVMRAGDQQFKCIDNILKGSPASSFRNTIDSVYFHHQLYFVSNLAMKLKQWETASALLFRYQELLSADLANVNRQNVHQLSAEYGNNRLKSDLAAASHKVTQTTIWIVVLLALILVGALFYSLLHVRTLKKDSDRDKARIAELQHKEV